MALTFSSSPATQKTLAAITEQFALTETDLHAITGQFVDDFNLGLSRYKEPMAMMYAARAVFIS
jgi:hypothetical protein